MNGIIYLIGIGPGKEKYMTYEAIEAIDKSDVIIGYKVYIDLVKTLIKDKEIISSGMKKEIERCIKAIEISKEGKNVALISSGDAGVYGMAGPLLELVGNQNEEIHTKIISGITAQSAAAAILGAPIMHDTARISLSDLLTPWEVIEKRLSLASEGDFIISLYNPRSKGRPNHLNKAINIILQFRDKSTVVGIVRNAGRDDEEIIITTLGEIPIEKVDMFCTIIIGNSNTYVKKDKMITPRGYKVERNFQP